ncbi:copine-3-like isoform X3 [Octopus sinensis]|uniref:Copine-3 n=1 Tax=Octopus sinensis TaxID=2607531 RepID=A0A7E6FGX9_9MOLL|nr:copine-3-like isoform X3 [Octopus sinensis]
MMSLYAPYNPVAAVTPNECVSTVELRIRCQNLLNKDIISLSDPLAVVYHFQGGRWMELGRTEMVKNSLHPVFGKSIETKYYFEEVQKIKVSVYDIDNLTHTLTDDDFLGEMECTLGQIVSCSPFTKHLLINGSPTSTKSTITITADEVSNAKELVEFLFAAEDLDKKDFFGKSDPFLEIFRTHRDNWELIHRTEVIKNNLNPRWQAFEKPMHTLCQGDHSKKLKIDCYDWNNDGTKDFIGSTCTTIETMMGATTKAIVWPLVNEKKAKKKKGYKDSGRLVLRSMKVTELHTFLEYVFGGMQINFTVAIDFTGSNGDPRQPSSLHYIDPYRPNHYMQAIRAVGNICQDYDSDKLFPAFGFGARIPPVMQVSHEFPLNFNMQNPHCAGIDGVLTAYQSCLHQVQLYGPTNAAPIIYQTARFAHAAQQAESSQGAASYFILLMLTDGVLSDLNDTKSAIVYASTLPMSLIIVGVGNADFTDMEILDSDNCLLQAANGNVAKRDIVQFVPFREFYQASSIELARHVLAEVPRQVESYYKMRRLPPKTPPQRPASLDQTVTPSQPPPSAPPRPPAPAKSPDYSKAPASGSAPGQPYPNMGPNTAPPQHYPGTAPQAPPSQHPGMAPQAPPSQHPGMAPQAPPSQHPGMAPQAPSPQYPGSAPQAPPSQYPGMASQGPPPQYPGMPHQAKSPQYPHVTPQAPPPQYTHMPPHAQHPQYPGMYAPQAQPPYPGMPPNVPPAQYPGVPPYPAVRKS